MYQSAVKCCWRVFQTLHAVPLVANNVTLGEPRKSENFEVYRMIPRNKMFQVAVDGLFGIYGNVSFKNFLENGEVFAGKLEVLRD